MAPEYKHLVWNRTDLIASLPGGSGSANYNYSLAKPPMLNADWPPSDYAGEVIPPYAVMRVISSPVLYKGEICWPVGPPDDTSMSNQNVGLHFFNGPSPIPVKGYGRATNDLPAPVLVDITADKETLPYGNLNKAVSNTNSVGDENITWLMAYASGSWALHPAADLVSYGAVSWIGADSGLAGGKVTVSFTAIPYTVVGRHPVSLSGETAGPTDKPGVAFLYSNQVWWVGGGAIGYGSQGITA